MKKLNKSLLKKYNILNKVWGLTLVLCVLFFVIFFVNACYNEIKNMILKFLADIDLQFMLLIVLILAFGFLTIYRNEIRKKIKTTFEG